MDERFDDAGFPTRRTVMAMAGAAPVVVVVAGSGAGAQPAPAPPHDGAGDFDFVIGDWKVHLRTLPDRLNGSDKWVEFEGTSSHRKLFGGPANLEEFQVEAVDGSRKIHAQTLRLYNLESRQWSIFLLDTADGTIGLPPVIGEFQGRVGEFYDQELSKGRAIFVRYQWRDLTPLSCRMEQAFSADGGRSWEVNWICALTRDRA